MVTGLFLGPSHDRRLRIVPSRRTRPRLQTGTLHPRPHDLSVRFVRPAAELAAHRSRGARAGRGVGRRRLGQCPLRQGIPHADRARRAAPSLRFRERFLGSRCRLQSRQLRARVSGRGAPRAADRGRARRARRRVGRRHAAHAIDPGAYRERGAGIAPLRRHPLVPHHRTSDPSGAHIGRSPPRAEGRRHPGAGRTEHRAARDGRHRRGMVHRQASLSLQRAHPDAHDRGGGLHDPGAARSQGPQQSVLRGAEERPQAGRMSAATFWKSNTLPT